MGKTMNNRNRKDAINDFVDQMEAKGYETVEISTDHILFRKETAAGCSHVTITRSALDDIISLQELN
jgi:hypothetical protein